MQWGKVGRWSGLGLDWWSCENKVLHRESQGITGSGYQRWNGGTNDHSTTRDDMIDDEWDKDQTELHLTGCACIGSGRMHFVLALESPQAYDKEGVSATMACLSVVRLFVLSISCLHAVKGNHPQQAKGQWEFQALRRGGFLSCHYFYAQHFLPPVLTALFCWLAIGSLEKYTVGPNLVQSGWKGGGTGGELGFGGGAWSGHT